MTGTNRPVRLVKAAKEFNVSIDSIIDFLGEMGFEVERNPNSKLSPEMYGHLTEEFHEEKHVKEVSQSRGLEYVGKETISIDDVKDKTDKKPADDFVSDEIMITNVGVRYEEEKPAEVKPEPEVQPEPVEEPKVEEVIEVEAEVKSEPEVEVEAETKEEPVVEQEVEKPEVKAEEPAAEPEVKEEAKSETTEEEDSGKIKVLGKVDLDSINQKTRPRKMTKAEKQKEAEEKKKATAAKKQTEKAKEEPAKAEPKKVEKAAPVAKKEQPAPAKAEKPKEEEKDNFIPTKVQKLSGPVVVDKIELPVENKPAKKKPVASSSDDKVGQKKKKRKRIRTGPAPTAGRPDNPDPVRETAVAKAARKIRSLNSRKKKSRSKLRKPWPDLPLVESHELPSTVVKNVRRFHKIFRRSCKDKRRKNQSSKLPSSLPPMNWQP